jgi:hypothetical protein
MSPIGGDDQLEHEPAMISGGGSMPFKSQAQRRKFAELLVEGKISNETFEEWNRETGGQRLPERVKHRAKRRKPARKKAKKKKAKKKTSRSTSSRARKR